MSGWNLPPGCGRLPGEWEEDEPSRCGRCGRWTAAGARFCAGHEPFCSKHGAHFVDVCSGCEADEYEAFYAAEEAYGASRPTDAAGGDGGTAPEQAR